MTDCSDLRSVFFGPCESLYRPYILPRTKPSPAPSAFCLSACQPVILTFPLERPAALTRLKLKVPFLVLHYYYDYDHEQNNHYYAILAVVISSHYYLPCFQLSVKGLRPTFGSVLHGLLVSWSQDFARFRSDVLSFGFCTVSELKGCGVPRLINLGFRV